MPAVAGAQILVAGEGPVVYGHHHLNTTNMAAQKKFYADTLGRHAWSRSVPVTGSRRSSSSRMF